MTAQRAVCSACGSADVRPLPELPDQSMLSDGRIIPAALRRRACLACGLAAHAEPPSSEATKRFFDSSYDLYAHPPGNRFERERQRHYAEWIASLIGPERPTSIFEIGCGNGSLLLELRDLWPSASFSGLEPAAAAARHAQQAGFDVNQGFLESTVVPAKASDLVLSVNVVEHAAEPVRFLEFLRSCMAQSGRGIVICPDGDLPSTELLIFDHLHSFSGDALSRLVAAAGLMLVSQTKAPAGLAGFQAAVVTRDGTSAPGPARTAQSAAALFDARRDFLLGWQQLDDLLVARAAGIAELVCFGAGECAQLLRAYAPRLWRKVTAFAVDGGAGFFDGRPVLNYGALKPATGKTFLPAVRRELHSTICQRLRSDGHDVLVWNDLLPA
jgi:SAM-dependent methyltransferase